MRRSPRVPAEEEVEDSEEEEEEEDIRIVADMVVVAEEVEVSSVGSQYVRRDRRSGN
jgi:hypothetical protein